MASDIYRPPKVHLRPKPSRSPPNEEFVVIDYVSPRHTNRNGTLLGQFASTFASTLVANREWLMPMIAQSALGIATIIVQHLDAKVGNTPAEHTSPHHSGDTIRADEDGEGDVGGGAVKLPDAAETG